MSDRDDDKPRRERVRLIRPSLPEEVGYGRPPRATRFKPGQSGNPRGRPKGAKSEAEMIRAALNRKVSIRARDGQMRKITIFEAIVQRLVEEAVKGNLKATQFLFNRIAEIDRKEPDSNEMNDEDRGLLEDYLREYVKKSEKPG